MVSFSDVSTGPTAGEEHTVDLGKVRALPIERRGNVADRLLSHLVIFYVPPPKLQFVFSTFLHSTRREHSGIESKRFLSGLMASRGKERKYER